MFKKQTQMTHSHVYAWQPSARCRFLSKHSQPLQPKKPIQPASSESPTSRPAQSLQHARQARPAHRLLQSEIPRPRGEPRPTTRPQAPQCQPKGGNASHCRCNGIALQDSRCVWLGGICGALSQPWLRCQRPCKLVRARACSCSHVISVPVGNAPTYITQSASICVSFPGLLCVNMMGSRSFSV